MVTYSDLIQLGILIVGIIALFIQVNEKRSNRIAFPAAVTSCNYTGN